MVWSVKDQKKLASMWIREFPAEDIAATINRPTIAVRAKARRMGLAIRGKSYKSRRPETPKVKRKCLKCRREFMAEKVHFICKECKATTEWRSQGGSFL
jgi:rRNA maturation endonuclease Nob1